MSVGRLWQGQLSSVLQCVAVCCSVLQCVALCCSVLQWIQRHNWRKMTSVCWSVLQCVAVCCSVLLCVAVNSTAQLTEDNIEKQGDVLCRHFSARQFRNVASHLVKLCVCGGRQGYLYVLRIVICYLFYIHCDILFVFVCVCVCVKERVCVFLCVCVCACVWERERGREREEGSKTWKNWTCHVCLASRISITVITRCPPAKLRDCRSGNDSHLCVCMFRAYGPL